MYRIAEGSVPTSPVGLAEAKRHLRVTHDDEDLLIGSLLDAATAFCENYQSRFYVRRQIVVHHEALPDCWRLPFAPVVSVDSVVVDGHPVESLFDPAGRLFVSATGPATITATVGYPPLEAEGTTDPGGNVPRSARQAILLLVGHWYELREGIISEKYYTESPFSVRALLDPERVFA